MRTNVVVLLIGTVCCLAWGCGAEPEPTEKEKGVEEAGKKLDYAEGAAEVLNEKGQPVGRSAGKGVGSLLKGLGSGIVDAVYPPVKINPSPEMAAAGITINKSEEGSSTHEGIEVNMTIAFTKIFKGRIRLQAFDAQKVEMGRTVSRLINQPADSILNLTVYLDKNTRMSDVAYCDAHLISPKTVSLMGDAAPIDGVVDSPLEAGLELGQMQEGEGTPLTVSQYVIFNKPFTGELQLRAYDATDAEIGRSQKLADLDQDADSSHTFEFKFHETVSIDSVSRYGLFARMEAGKKKKKKLK